MTIKISIGKGGDKGNAKRCQCSSEQKIVYIDSDTGAETDGGTDSTGDTYTPAPWSESLSVTDYASVVGRDPLAFFNFEDGETASYSVREDQSVALTNIEDKTGNQHEFFRTLSIDYDIFQSQNVAVFNAESQLWNNTIFDSIPSSYGQYYIAIIFSIFENVNNPLETLFSLTTNSLLGESLYVALTDSPQNSIEVKASNSSNEVSLGRSTQTVSLNTKTLLLFQQDGHRIRVWLHDGVTHSNVEILRLSADVQKDFNITELVIGAFAQNENPTNFFSGNLHGVVCGAGILPNSYNLINSLSEVWAIQNNTPNILTLTQDMVSAVSYSSAGLSCFDYLSRDVLTAPSSSFVAGLFEKAVDFDGSTVGFSANSQSLAFDLTNKTQFFLAIRFKPTSLNQTYKLLTFEDDQGLAWSIGVTSSNKIEVLVSTNATRNFQEDDRHTNPVILNEWNYFFLYSENGTKWRLLTNEFRDSDFNHINRANALWSGISSSSTITEGSARDGTGRAYCVIDERVILDRVWTESERQTWINEGQFRPWPYGFQTSGGGPVVVAPPTDSDDEEFFWGPQFGGGTGPANVELKSGNYHITFTTPPSSALDGVTSTIESVSIWWKAAPNYARGSSPWNYSIELCADSSGSPGSPVLNGRVDDIEITADFNAPGGDSSWRQQIQKISFSNPPIISAGTKYHLRLINNAANKLEQWVSINCLLSWPQGGYSSAFTYGSPTRTKDDWSIYRGSNLKYGNEAPMAVFRYNNGETQGCGYLDTWVARGNYGSGDSARIVGGNVRVRQKLTPHIDLKLKKVFISGARRAGDGDIVVELKDSGGVVLDSTTIPSSSFPLRQTALRRGLNYYTQHWGSSVFSGDAELSSDTLYYLEFSAPSGSEYYIGVLHDALFLPGDKFPSGGTGRYGTFFGLDASADMSLNNGASWQSYHRSAESPRTGKYDLAFYTVAQAVGETQGTGALDWEPSDLAGSSIWFDMQDNSNIVLYGSEVLSVTSKGSSVVASSIGSQRPTLGVSGYQYLEFLENSPQRLNFPSFVSAETVMVVTRELNNAVGFTSFFSNEGASFSGELYIFGSSGNFTTASVNGTGSSEGRVSVNGGDWSSQGTDPNFANGIFYPETNINILVLRYDTGTNLASRIGPRDAFNNNRMQICEILFSSLVLADSEIARLVGYAAHKYGISGQLPSNHPYKFSRPKK